MELLKSVCFLFLIIQLSESDLSGPSKPYNTTTTVYVPATGDGVIISPLQNFVAVFCDVKTYEQQDYPESDKNFTELFTKFCDAPKESYASVLLEHNYNIKNIRALSIVQPPDDFVLKVKHLDGLNLTEVNIRGESTCNLVRINFLEALSNVQSLHFENVVIETIPETTKAITVKVNFGKFKGPWEGCENLQYLMIAQVEVPDIKNWLAKCTKLNTIILDRLWLVHSLRWVLQGATVLTNRGIRDYNIRSFTSDLFISNVNLRKVVLNNNRIEYLERFGNLTKLEELNLSTSWLADRAWNMKILGTLPTLRALALADVYLPEFCNHFNKSIRPFSLLWAEVEVANAVEPFNVTILNLEGTGMSRLCFADWPSLQELYLHRNNISVLEVNQLPINKSGLMRVNLFGNPVRRVEFDEKNYEFLKSRANFTRLEIIMNFSLDCDCHGAWFARAARDYVITATLAGCCDGTPLTIVPPEQIECDKFSCEGCVCRRWWKDNMTRANCTARGLRALPQVPALKEMIASNNLIETIYVHELPQTLQLLDLRNNRIARLDEAAGVALFEMPNRSVQLSGNPIICDCENKPFLEALRGHRTQVDDYNNVTCAGDGKTMDEVDFDELCDTKKVLLTATLAVSGMLVGLAALVGALYCRYEKTIKIFLYARGLCLCCMAEDELDAEREYDAFVSFTHEDEQFVMEELVVHLEKEYKICVHYRDWVVGDMIPTQIMRSVENSRRTIIVLSKKFVKSLWGLLEFRTAHFCALNEGRVRVIVLVIDDATEDDTLDLQLRGYLLTNTYLKWGDPWFWDKLKYAMPRKGMVETETVSRNLSDMSNFNRSNMLRMGVELPALPLPTTC